MQPKRHWQDLTAPEFAALDRARTIAVLPVAATEQHGPHLPLSVDADIARGVIDAALPHLPADLPVLFLPPQVVGFSPEHTAFAGTLTLKADTLMRLWTELAESVAAAGVPVRRLASGAGHDAMIVAQNACLGFEARGLGICYMGTTLFRMAEIADLLQLPETVAPVTTWRYYDTIYTERYLQTPQLNAAGYDDNSPITHVNKLKGNLLLIHGTGDDNVHFQNAVDLTNALIAADKQFESFYYPNRNHGIYGGNTTWHLYTMMTDFLKRKL